MITSDVDMIAPIPRSPQFVLSARALWVANLVVPVLSIPAYHQAIYMHSHFDREFSFLLVNIAFVEYAFLFSVIPCINLCCMISSPEQRGFSDDVVWDIYHPTPSRADLICQYLLLLTSTVVSMPAFYHAYLRFRGSDVQSFALDPLYGLVFAIYGVALNVLPAAYTYVAVRRCMGREV